MRREDCLDAEDLSSSRWDPDRSVKVLGHIHTFNDADVIERSLEALLNQTRPLDEILVVDNASTDGTLDRHFPRGVTVIRNAANLGTSGAIEIGLRYAMDNAFFWAWILDGDSEPYPDALERLLELWDHLPADVQNRTWRLSCLPLELPEKAVTTFSVSLPFHRGSALPKPRHGHVFTETGYRQVRPGDGRRYYECDATIWTGCFFRVDAVRKVGLPASDYVLDFGEYEYGFRGKRCGYHGLMDQESLLRHNIRGQASFHFSFHRIGPLGFQLIEMKPIRCYYTVRNMIYFWLYDFRPLSLVAVSRQFCKLLALTLNFMIRPHSRYEQMRACLLGFWHGLSRNMSYRY